MDRSPSSRPPSSRSRWRTVLLVFGAALFLFEEWIWVGFLRLFGWMGRLGLLRWLDAKLVRLGPVAALIILCIPMVLLFPVKIAGLWMIASGRFLAGCCLMLIGKLASTAIIARIFITCRLQLLQMPWFARLHALTCTLRLRIHESLARQPAWSDAKRMFGRMRRAVRHWWPMGEHRRQGTLRRWRSRRRTAVAAELRPIPHDDRTG